MRRREKSTEMHWTRRLNEAIPDNFAISGQQTASSILGMAFQTQNIVICKTNKFYDYTILHLFKQEEVANS
ncbi:CLUMA_CG001667, isoform A [Clunio marinus]|uniref:CLUMA_CG001667, isoform A n=1 Tax=Clunio marinus TaxID=568069 RepID=A0A1J1HIK2_9DIPT|nr:CLUMA_CG001667, isoform A [Clunio marinus]